MSWTGTAARDVVNALGGWYEAPVVAAVAAVDGTGTAIASTGDLPEGARFEIGSVTKTMTATVLALLVGEGRVRLEDGIGDRLSAGDHGGITIRELATHTSGLPSRPPNLVAADPADPWAGYTFARAEEGLRAARVTPGNPWRYSNLGYQLLGLILERAAGRDYPTLMRERLLVPLAMAHSGVGPRGAGELLPGYVDGRVVPAWTHPWGAGGVEASIEDLGRYARACLFPPAGPLGAALTLAGTPVVRVDDATEQALAWVVRDGRIRGHTGGTGGFGACVSVDPAGGRAIAVLVNAGGGPAGASRLRQAARLALSGADPGRAEAPRTCPSWRDEALTAVHELIEGRIAQVHARLVAARREAISPERLERAWVAAVGQAGPPRDVAIERHEVAATGAVVADLAIAFAAGTRRLRVVVLPSGELGGFAFLPAPAG